MPECSILDNGENSTLNRWFSIHAGVEHVGGNMFDKIPRGDAIILKVIFLIVSTNIFLKTVHVSLFYIFVTRTRCIYAVDSPRLGRQRLRQDPKELLCSSPGERDNDHSGVHPPGDTRRNTSSANSVRPRSRDGAHVRRQR